MMEWLFVFACWCLCAYAAHEGVRWGNSKFEELDMSPNIAAVIGFIFGVTGLVFLALYAMIKIMIKGMIKK